MSQPPDPHLTGPRPSTPCYAPSLPSFTPCICFSPTPPASPADVPVSVGGRRANNAGRKAVAFPPTFLADGCGVSWPFTTGTDCVTAISPSGRSTGTLAGPDRIGPLVFWTTGLDSASSPVSRGYMRKCVSTSEYQSSLQILRWACLHHGKESWDVPTSSPEILPKKRLCFLCICAWTQLLSSVPVSYGTGSCPQECMQVNLLVS